MVMETLAELLDAARVRLKSHAPGHTEHIACPKCDGGRSKEISFSVTIDDDGEGFASICHRGSCGHSEGARTKSTSAPRRKERGYQTPAPATAEQQASRPEWFCQAFAERKIGERTIQQLGIYAVERNFPHPFGRLPTIVFPYLHHGEVVNRKYRSHPKQTMSQEAGALPTLFNVDRLGENPEEIVWVEGEMDVAALFECGITHAVSLKDGAPKEATFKEDDKRFEALRTHSDVLGKARKIILAGDSDDPGIALREELARRLGRHRCFLVTWPEGSKDAGDVLRQHGPEAVLEAIETAEPYPIDGVQRIQVGSLLALRRLPAPATMTTGTRGTDAILKLPTEGRLIIVTGYPGGGKTNWVRFVMVHTAGNHDRRWAVFSPEMQPWEQFVAECAEVWSGKTFRPMPPIPCMDDAEVSEAETWLANRVMMLVCDAEDQAPTIDWVLERARVTVLRDGITDLVIDPWNEIDHTRLSGISETEYIGRGLQRLKAFGLRHGCNIWLIAHPAKPQPVKNGETKGGAPGPYDISGSAHWFNRADLGITVHSPHSGSAEIHLWKARFVRRWGKRGAIALLDFDPIIGRYSTPITPVDALEPVQHSWHDR